MRIEIVTIKACRNIVLVSMLYFALMFDFIHRWHINTLLILKFSILFISLLFGLLSRKVTIENGESLAQLRAILLSVKKIEFLIYVLSGILSIVGTIFILIIGSTDKMNEMQQNILSLIITISVLTFAFLSFFLLYRQLK